jgi:glycosyltransferase involved in cell wall biosynthesis
MRGPLVSVVIPFLDPPVNFLAEAVASVVAQDYRPLELLLVNDGSHVSVAEAAKRLVKDAPLAARYVEHTGGGNRGSSATRNLGGSLARGKYLAFLDADDVWVTSKVREQVHILENDPQLAMVFGVTRYWYSWSGGEGQLDDFVVDRGIKRPVDIHPPEFVSLFLRGKIIVPSTSNSMIRREAFLDCGGFEESFRGMYDDQAFLVKLGLKRPVAAVPRCWDSYRQHPHSMTARAGNLGAESAARSTFLAWVRDYCDQHDISTPEVREAVNKEMWLAANPRSALVTHRMKRWWLRFEELFLPARLRRHIWCRPAHP